MGSAFSRKPTACVGSRKTGRTVNLNNLYSAAKRQGRAADQQPLHLQDAPRLNYDLWTVALDFLDYAEWVSVACAAPALDDLVVYHCAELRLTPRMLLQHYPTESLTGLQCRVRWEQLVEPQDPDVVVRLLRVMYPRDATPPLFLSVGVHRLQRRPDVDAVQTFVANLASHDSPLIGELHL
jgi:hypothetical protein